MQDILKYLSLTERKILPEVEKPYSQLLIKYSDELLRGYKWLEDKKIITLTKTETNTEHLTKKGEEYQKKGLPEEKLLKLLKKGPQKKSDILKELEEQELNACIGLFKRKNALNITKKQEELIFELTKEIKFNSWEEKQELIKRGIIELKKNTNYEAKLTQQGKKVLELLKKDKTTYLEKITPELLKTKNYKNITFREYDLNIKAPIINRGRKHFVTEAVEYIKNIWLELGFEEMTGNHVQSSFWNLDALFVPQDHPAREMQDTFYINHKSKIEKKHLENIKKVHEGKTIGKGWGYEFKEEIAQKTLLRTHNTVLTAIALSKLTEKDLPKKYFSVGKVYRNEALDWKHLFEFQQVEGFVIDQNASLLSLKNYLKEFFTKMGYEDVRIRPAYFPYTEPSAEIDVFHPQKKEWIEIGGAGILRPEVTESLLGFKAKTLAFGLGMERIISNYYQITDIREIYENDINKIKNKKIFIKR